MGQSHGSAVYVLHAQCKPCSQLSSAINDGGINHRRTVDQVLACENSCLTIRWDSDPISLRGSESTPDVRWLFLQATHEKGSHSWHI